jgi:hypothetical protein
MYYPIFHNCQRAKIPTSKACQEKYAEQSIVKTKSGGAEEDRTPDPLLAKQVLSQLSYSPEIPCGLAPSFQNWWARGESNH